jgi:hypothetical protein
MLKAISESINSTCKRTNKGNQDVCSTMRRWSRWYFSR